MSRIENIRAKIRYGQTGFAVYRDAEDQAHAVDDVEYLLSVADAATKLLDLAVRAGIIFATDKDIIVDQDLDWFGDGHAGPDAWHELITVLDYEPAP